GLRPRQRDQLRALRAFGGGQLQRLHAHAQGLPAQDFWGRRSTAVPPTAAPPPSTCRTYSNVARSPSMAVTVARAPTASPPYTLAMKRASRRSMTARGNAAWNMLIA